MTSKNLRFARRAAAAAVSLLLGTSAQAIVVTGTWDPSFGPPFPNLGYRGSGQVFVDDACLAANGFVWWDATCGGGLTYGSPMGLLSASADLYDARLFVGPLPNPQPPTIGAPLVFQSPLPKPGDNNPMWGVYIQGGQVIGFDTLLINQQPHAAVVGGDATVLWPGGFLDLYFTSGHKGESCDLGMSFCGSGGGGSSAGFSAFGPAGAATGAVLASLTGCIDGSCTRNDSTPAAVTFSQVPEPGTLALVLGALGGGWFARRRKKHAI